jgi:subtilisin family serine protease
MLRKLLVVMIALVIGFNSTLTLHAETRSNLVNGQTTENVDGVTDDPIANEINDDANSVVSAKEVILVLNNIDDLNRLGIEEEIVKVYTSISMVKIKVPDGQSAASLIAKYEHSSFIRYVYEETVVTISYTPTDPSYAAKQWNLQRIALEPIWDLTKGSSTVIVAVIDTGVGPHADLDGLVKGVDITGTSGATCLSQSGEDNTPGQCSFDGGNHGTAVASVIAANMNATGIAGIAPNVSIMPVKIFAKGSLTTGSAEIVSGIKWAVDHGADIINISMGSYNRVQAEEDIINYALDRGVIIVAASGNDGGQAAWPAAYDGVIAVGSTQQGDYLSTFSNWGRDLSTGPIKHDSSICEYGRYVVRCSDGHRHTRFIDEQIPDI